jgi:cytochrome c-type biogenesis protein CcmH
MRHSEQPGIAREASNVAILRDQLRELEADHASGNVAQEQYEQSKRELEQRVLEESVPVEVSAAAAPRAGWKTAFALIAIVPIASLALYAVWGSREAFDPAAQVAQKQEHDLSPDQVNAMVDKLAAKLKSDPGNVEGWVILARTYYAMGRYAEAVPAFERATTLAPDDARLLADYADALGATQQSLQGKPTQLVEKALQIEPTYW